MREENDLLSSDLIEEKTNFDIFYDSSIGKMQMNLVMMGFDIEMINKIITLFKINNIEEAIDYLIKSENGMWNHPFIPKEEEQKEDKNVMNNVINTINSIKNTASLGQSVGDLVNDLNENIININENNNNNNNNNNNKNENNKINENEEDICEICGESKKFHIIKEFKNYKNDNLENINEEIDKIIKEDENQILNENVIEDNEINKEDEEQEEIDDEPNICKICLDDIENPIVIEKCNHKFCQECFHSYLINLIKNNQIDNIPCPKNKCKNINLSEVFFSQFLTDQEYFKYRQFKAQNEIARDKKKLFCPLCDSYADIGDQKLESLDSNSPDYIKSTLKCKNGHEFCSCGRPLHEGECYHDEKEFKDFVENEKIKKCPRCGFLIKKMKGCNHMTCGNPICKYEFCWLCMQEAVPGHFDYGDCAGKQFYDPDSFANKLRQNHPFLFIIYCAFMAIFILIVFVICCMALPGITLAITFYFLVFEDELFDNCNKKAKIIIYFGYVIYGFALETLVYVAWGIFFVAVGLCLVALVIGVFAYFFRCLFKSLCSFCFEENNENNNEVNNMIAEFL